ncbi:hypothetical protein COL154_013901 [Colletotrichum chrysophilum]|nr:hypothetical protein COL154_013901 [Colletotrichum chrysophilum]
MRFKFHALSAAGFRAWIAKAKESGNALNRRSYLKLAKPSIANPVQYYASVQSDLYDRILNQCVHGSRMCIKDEMAYDLRDGGGLFGPSCTTAGTGVGGSDDLKYQPKRTASQRPIYLDASVLLDRIF